MAKNKKNNKKPKPSVKVQDMAPEKNPTGGRKAGKTPLEYIKITMKEVIIT